MTHWHATYLTIHQLNDRTHLQKQHLASCRTRKALRDLLEEKGAVRSWSERKCKDSDCTELK